MGCGVAVELARTLLGLWCWLLLVVRAVFCSPKCAFCWNNPYIIDGGDDELALLLVAGSSRACGTQEIVSNRIIVTGFSTVEWPLTFILLISNH